MLSSEPSGNVCSRPRLGLERGDPIGNAFIVDRRDRRSVGNCRRPRLQSGCVRGRYLAILLHGPGMLVRSLPHPGHTGPGHRFQYDMGL